MAVRTLRNFIMGTSLMASTSTFLIVGTRTLSDHPADTQPGGRSAIPIHDGPE